MKALRLMQNTGHPIEGILHIGANEGQERAYYAASGAASCLYVEPVDEIFSRLQHNIAGLAGHRAVKAVCSDTEGETVTFHIASNSGLSSSMLDLGPHAQFHPSINYVASQTMTTTTVDRLLADLGLPEVPNLLVIDTQGADLKVLKGACNTLRDVDGVFVEVSREPLYDGGCTQEEITAFLKTFNLEIAWMSLDVNGHGDAFYSASLRPSFVLPTYEGDIALGKKASQSSTSPWSAPDDAQGAVNGRKTGRFGFHTDEEDSPWWQVDLAADLPLNEIRIYNRLDAARERSRTLRVHISQDGSKWDLVHDQGGKAFGRRSEGPLRVFVDQRRARYVRLSLNERTMLHLDAVEIY